SAQKAFSVSSSSWNQRRARLWLAVFSLWALTCFELILWHLRRESGARSALDHLCSWMAGSSSSRHAPGYHGEQQRQQQALKRVMLDGRPELLPAKPPPGPAQPVA